MNVQVAEASRARARANFYGQARPTSGRSGRQTRGASGGARARGEATDVDARADDVNRRRAMLAIFGGASALSAGAESARADVGAYFSNLLVEKPPPPKREILLPDLEVTPLTREEGYRGTTGANKSKAQIEFAQYIAPIIEENVELDFGSYFRLALADLGSYFVVGKKLSLIHISEPTRPY